MTPSPDSDGSDAEGSSVDLPTNRKATCSVLFGIAAFACVYFFTFGAFALGVPAITTGVHAKREIAASRGTEGGDGLAGIGLIVGGAAIVVAILTFVLSSLPGR